MDICEVCKYAPLDMPHERRRGLCDECAKTTGLWLEPPTLRPTRPCQRCGNAEFICAQLRERGTVGGDGAAFLAPMALTFADTRRTGFATTEETHPWAPMGIVIAFACRACGLTELYTLEADKIPIGPEHGTHLVNCAPIDGPLR